MDGNQVCPRCSKRVYFAERRLYNGKFFHMSCAAAQQDDDLANKRHFAIHEDIFCNPHDRAPVNSAQAPVNVVRVEDKVPVNSSNKLCARCNTVVPDSAKFCTLCGFKFPEQVEVVAPPAPKTPTCSSCGDPHLEGDRFCRTCGNKLFA